MTAIISVTIRLWRWLTMNWRNGCFFAKRVPQDKPEMKNTSLLRKVRGISPIRLSLRFMPLVFPEIVTYAWASQFIQLVVWSKLWKADWICITGNGEMLLLVEDDTCLLKGNKLEASQKRSCVVSIRKNYIRISRLESFCKHFQEEKRRKRIMWWCIIGVIIFIVCVTTYYFDLMKVTRLLCSTHKYSILYQLCKETGIAFLPFILL